MEANFTSDTSGLQYAGSVTWIVLYTIVICAAVAGNILTLLAIILSRQLNSTVSNQFIFSLAVSDLLVGASTPYHMCFYLVDHIGKTEATCLIRFVLISFACEGSILNLFLIATDRYIAVVHPLKYNTWVTRRSSVLWISVGWLISLTLSTVPIYWNLWEESLEEPKHCDVRIIPANYFHFVLTPLFVFTWTTMFFVYLKIWKEAAMHAKRIRSTNNLNQCHTISDTKSIQVVLLTLGCFSVCWMPYFVVTTYYRITQSNNQFSLLYEIAFTLAVANSGMNPLIYAWKNSNFRNAFSCLLRCKSPNEEIKKTTGYITNHVPHKKDSVNGNQHEKDIEMEDSQKGDECECSCTTDTTTIGNT